MAFSTTFPMLSDLTLSHKRVFLRADLNVPLINEQIGDDSRLKALLPTIHYIQQQGGKVILATHIGRPDPKSQPLSDPTLSTRILIPWFEKQGLSIELEPDLKRAVLKSKEGFSSILLLENLRFFAGERDTNTAFAHMLAQLADVYVNDAFGMMHRHDTSVTMLAEQFNSKSKVAGLLVAQEVENLTSLLNTPSHPYVMILGGKKIADKLSFLSHLIEKPQEQRPSSFLIGGPLAYTLMKAQGVSIGASLYAQESLKEAEELLRKAEHNKVIIALPVDHLITYPGACHVELCSTASIPNKATGVDIGEQTLKLFCSYITNAHTIFINGPVGIYEKSSSAYGTRGIIECVAANNGYKVAGGGDILGAINRSNVADKFSFLSTGGGATLAFLAAKDPMIELPGFASLIEK